MSRKKGTSEASNVVSLTVASNAVTPNCDQANVFDVSNGANLTINNPTGTPADTQRMEFRIKNTGGSPITITMGTSYRNGTDITAPGNVTNAKINRIMYEYYAADGKWDLISEIRGF